MCRINDNPRQTFFFFKEFEQSQIQWQPFYSVFLCSLGILPHKPVYKVVNLPSLVHEGLLRTWLTLVVLDLHSCMYSSTSSGAVFNCNCMQRNGLEKESLIRSELVGVHCNDQVWRRLRQSVMTLLKVDGYMR